MRENSDDELMAMVKDGDASAFNRLLDRHGDAVYGYCMRTLAGNRSLTEDIAQEVWLKVLRKAGTYSGQNQFKAWLMTITRNETVNAIRKQLPLDYSEEEDSVAELPADTDLEQSFLDAIEEDRMKAAIDRLPEQFRLTLILWCEGSLSYEEIGEKLEITTAAVRSNLYRARLELKKLLGAK